MKTKTRVVAGIAGAALIAAGVVSSSAADVPDSNGTIHACYTTSSGALRVIDTGSGGSCYSYETAISWPSAVPSLKYFKGTVQSGGGGNVGSVTVDCPDNGLPITLWVAYVGASGVHPLSNQSSVSGDEILDYPGGDASKNPIGIHADSNEIQPFTTVQYEIICT